MQKIRFSKTSIDDIIFQARWILYPVNIGLMIAAIVYAFKIVVDAWLLIYHSGAYIFGSDDSDPLVLAAVRLLEEAMTEWLLVSTIMGGHQIYIRRFRQKNGPEWLEHVDTVTMKVKLGLAFVGYSSAKLLEDIITTDVPTDIWIRHVVTHCVFLLTCLIVAIVHRCVREDVQKSEPKNQTAE